ncbi:hypothetical protein Tco_0472292, partial [Tanacetum coccineum]
MNSLWTMEQCRQGKSAKWIRNLRKRIGSEGWARGIHQVLDCSPTNRERELGLDCRET